MNDTRNTTTTSVQSLFCEKKGETSKSGIRAKIRASYFPDAILSAPHLIPYENLPKAGIRAVFLDLDNTLAVDGTRKADDYAKEIVARIRSVGMLPVVVSNGEYDRVVAFAESIPADSIPKAQKPSPEKLLAYMTSHNLQPNEVLMVGDQLITDVHCARQTGMHILLTKPRAKHEIIQIRMKRILEHLLIAIGGRRHWASLEEKGDAL